MPELHPIALYFAVITLIALRASEIIGQHTKRPLVRDLLIAAAVGVAALFVPMKSSAMALLLVAAFLMGTIGLSALLVHRFGQGSKSFSGKILVLFTLVILSMLVVSAPLLLILWKSNT